MKPLNIECLHFSCIIKCLQLMCLVRTCKVTWAILLIIKGCPDRLIPSNQTSYWKLYFRYLVQNSLRFNMDIIFFDLRPQKKRQFFWIFFFQIWISTSKFLIWEKKFSCQLQKCKLELCMSNGSEVLNYLSFLLKAPMN